MWSLNIWSNAWCMIKLRHHMRNLRLFRSCWYILYSTRMISDRCFFSFINIFMSWLLCSWISTHSVYYLRFCTPLMRACRIHWNNIMRRRKFGKRKMRIPLLENCKRNIVFFFFISFPSRSLRRDSQVIFLLLPNINRATIYLQPTYSESSNFSRVVEPTHKFRFEINRYDVNVSRVTGEI